MITAKYLQVGEAAMHQTAWIADWLPYAAVEEAAWQRLFLSRFCRWRFLSRLLCRGPGGNLSCCGCLLFNEHRAVMRLGFWAAMEAWFRVEDDRSMRVQADTVPLVTNLSSFLYSARSYLLMVLGIWFWYYSHVVQGGAEECLVFDEVAKLHFIAWPHFDWNM